ncbi:ion transport protein [Skeletonema marinoi]|uniref:Ion transport protein n=1 Tax=Skeletonema marinoi TaxID=267567 RepID=A0AAD8YJ08_9STRA|nr:ion transport protein [Skeletonema marinoi]
MKAFRPVSRASDKELLNQYYQEHKIPIFFPWSVYYRIWWFLTVIAALFGMFLETYEIAFSQAGWSRRSAIMEICIYCIFGLDIIINFNLAYYDERDKIVLARLPIAVNYLKRMFWVDLMGVFPFYYVATAISGQMGESNTLTQTLALLRLFTLVRLHRVPRFFSIMKYSSKISLMSLTLIRDLSAVLTWTHIWACIMFFIARELAFDPDNTWLGSDIANLTGFEQYVTSLYWSVVTFTTVGYGDFSPVHPIEQIFGVVYMILNVVLMAWVIGSITLLIVKNDQKTGIFRETLHVLHKYATLHDFDANFTKKLKNQLQLDFDNREIADEQVLQFFPVGVRQRVLRRLYLQSLINTDLMRGTRNQFVDAFLSLCRVEVFSPGDELLQRGAVSSELYLLLDGSLEVASSDNLDNSLRARDGGLYVASVWSLADSTEMGSASGKRRIIIPKGEFVNELGFFTESPQMDSIRTRGVCKILTLTRSDYKSLSADHPGSAGRVLTNLLAKVQELPTRSVMHERSRFDRESEADIAQAEVHVEHTKMVVEDLIKMHINKQKDEHTTRFCFAASRGDTSTIAALCDQGFDPNSSDYDQRTALMVAAMKGNVDVVTKLLEYSCDPNLQDVNGTTALMEATKNNHEDVCSILLSAGAHLSLSESQAASALCQAVFDGDTMMLRRLLKANIQVNASDYDKRTAAHIAASESNHLALQVLVEHGADITLKDRWGNTPADDAKRANSVKILDYLSSLEQE